MKKFKIRCSAIGDIMGDDSASNITEKQLKELNRLEKKLEVDSVSVTLNQHGDISRLRAKRDATPQLSQGAKSHCKKWLREELYGRRIEIRDRKIRKGLLCEDKAIELAYPGSVKCEDEYCDTEYITGHPDVFPDHIIIADVKCSWDEASFPLFETKPDKGYWWQGQGYMFGFNREHYELTHCLINTPEELLYENEEAVDYNDLPRHLRVKTFEFERDDEAFEKIAKKVILCREYIEELLVNLEG